MLCAFRTSLVCALAFLTTTLLLAQPPVVPGFPNIAQTPGAILSGLNAPQQGRTAILAYHNGLLFTVPEVPSSQPGADFLVRTWDISDPTDPVELTNYGTTPMPINAHGYFKSGEYLVLGPNWPPEAPWSFRWTSTPGIVQRTEFPGLHGAGVRGQLFQPSWVVGDTYWSYGEVSGDAWIEIDGVEQSSWDHLGLTGVVGHPFLLGNLLIFASDQSRTGVATYDVSDPTNPVLLDVLTDGGPGGYWPELWGGGDGKLYIVFPYRTGGNGFRVVDATDPTALEFVTDRPLAGDASMYIQFQDEFAFMGSHKVDMRTFESVLFLDGENTVRPSDGGTGIDTSQFLLPLGNLLVTGGVGPNEGMAIWAHQAAPDTRGPSVGYHIPRAGQTNYPTGGLISLLIHETLETPTIVNGTTFIVRPLGGSPISGALTLAFDDILTFTPDEALSPDTTYEVVLPAGGIKDAAGNGMVGYSFTFSTGSSVGGNAPPVISSFTASAYPVAPDASVDLAASASDPDTNPVEYRFDFGDGSPRTAWSSTASASHAYTDTGHYRALVQVRDPSGAIATETTVVTVLVPPAGPHPRSGGPIVCDSSGRRVWKANPDNGTVTTLDADTLAVIDEAVACDEPRGVALSAAGELWVACHGDDRLVILDATNGSFLAEIATGWGSAPNAVATSPDGTTVYATFEGSDSLRVAPLEAPRGHLARYDAATRQQTGSLDLGPGPRALAVSGDGARVLVGRFLAAGNHAEVWDVDTATLTLSRTLRLPKLGGEENRDSTAAGRGVANYLRDIVISPDSATAWVASTKANTERGLTFFNDLDQDNTVRAVLTQVDLASGTVLAAVDVDNSDSPSSLAFSPLGDYLLATLQGNDDVLVLDALELSAATGLGSFVTRLGAGAAPQGLCVDASTGRTFAANFLGRSATALETLDLFQTGENTVPGSEIATVASETLLPDVLLGKRIFYHASDPRMSGEGYLSCATCHLDGGQDGQVWDFTGRGEGLRNTTTLVGRAGMDHGNVHWTANFDEIQDFENDIRGAFGGQGLMDDSDFAATSDPLGLAKAGLSGDLDALASYVASLGRSTLPRSPYREADGSLTATAELGRAVFAELACGSCHGGERFTESTTSDAPGGVTLRDVGTRRTTSGGRLGGPLPGLDTPTLLGVWATPPYFHDGSATTLEDVFRVAGGTLYAAEDGAASGGANVVTQWVNLNNDDTVRGRAYVGLDNGTARLTLANVDGGPGGVGAIELRYSSGFGAHDFEVLVNGASHPMTLQPTGNDPQWRHTAWEIVRIENVTLTAGATNTVEIAAMGGYPNVSLDDVLVTTAPDLAAAAPHRIVLSQPMADQTALLAYLRQLDGQPETAPSNEIFRDGFELGNAMAWSSQVP